MKAIITIILLTFSLHAASLATNKTTYTVKENIVVSLKHVTGDYSNWVGIFKQGTTNTWEHVTDAIWFYRKDTLTFTNLSAGNYQARLFYNDSLHQEAASNNFVVTTKNQATIVTDKVAYESGQTISVILRNIQGKSNNFIGIFKQDATSDWNNLLKDNWFDFRNGIIRFRNTNDLEDGNYQIRLFYNDTLTVKKSINFKIGDIKKGTVSTNKTTYNAGESIKVTVANVKGNKNNWVGIFKKGSPNNWGYVLAENWFDFKNGTINFPQNFIGGSYEVRLFYNDSLNVETIAKFEIKNNILLTPTVYEDAENKNTAGWSTMEGPYSVENIYKNKTRAIFGKGKWVDGNSYNMAFYRLILDNGDYWNNTSQHILELDINGGTACFQIGVEIRTTKGIRGMFFSIWYGKKHYPAIKTVYDNGYTELTFPLAESYRFSNTWKHLKIDLQKKLQQLEPNNEILSVEAFILNGMTGSGAIDNIKLSQ